MKDQLSLNDEDDCDSPRAAYYWWRSAAKFEECARFKLDIPNLSMITPTLRLLKEMERLALIAADGLGELRHKLFTYRSGDFWVPTGGLKKEEMDIPPLNTILLVGFHNSGKSSLVNLMYSVLGRSGLIPFAQTSSRVASNYRSWFMEEHNVLRSMQSGFCVYDTRGFDYDRVCEGVEELSEWMTDGVHHNQLCLRSGDPVLSKDELEIPMLRSSSKFANRRVNCVMVVANVAEIYKAFKAGDKKPLDALRDLFCSPALSKCNEKPILILTHGDKLSTEDRIDCRLKICEYLGVSEATGVYDIVCVTEYGFLADECDPVTAYALTEAVYRALLISDKGHLPKRDLQDWALFLLSWLMCFMGAFFALLAHVFSKLGHTQRDRFKF
uniref:G domain-containing protein n=1 Tax=Davidia involucrata TaxID=16924 RepID=A0A5B7BUY8_DAVIN